jgi:small-conductance mechanosensitive channel
VALNITLAVAILGYFGVQTTTFAALIAAIGLAIGTAWAGLLANFAAGAFLLVPRPFKVGDFISTGGIVGSVHGIGLFVTTLDTPDNILTFIGNNKISPTTSRTSPPPLSPRGPHHADRRRRRPVSGDRPAEGTDCRRPQCWPKDPARTSPS